MTREALSDYDYHLPDEAIAQEPLADRSASRLLVLHKDSGEIEHLSFKDVPRLLSRGDLLVLNDTRVTAVRVFGKKESGGGVEALLLSEIAEGVFEALAKPGRRLSAGTRVGFGDLRAEILEVLDDGRRVIRFDPVPDLGGRLRKIGQVPLPPYITKHLAEAERYQTVYGATAGSAAAPTAGLHFTDAMLAELIEKGVGIARVTLDVGLDTFRPIQSDDLDLHRMRGERCTVPEDTAEAVARCRGRVIAVGTTSVRTLESSAAGPKIITPGTQTTSLFIRPGYRFKAIDGMFTNFHMPRTTMLLLISALAGREAVLRSYAQALDRGYRFLSFGDAMLIF
ncbi:MAG: tRNA preQ1(34) S-adenosylmethionine ribosyltransferase-isomerase QueA [Fimbriimonadaceae bacterium]